MSLPRKIYKFFDRLEDYIRISLSHFPILYALVGAIGIILVWKGVWETAELIPGLFGVPSLIIGILILLLSGLLVSFFIGDSIILSGFKKEKKFTEKTEKEILEAEKTSTEILTAEIRHIHQDIEEVKKELRDNKTI